MSRKKIKQLYLQEKVCFKYIMHLAFILQECVSRNPIKAISLTKECSQVQYKAWMGHSLLASYAEDTDPAGITPSFPITNKAHTFL